MFQLFLYFILIQKIFSQDLFSLQNNKRELTSTCSNGLSNGNYIFRSSSKQSWSFCGVSGTGYHEFRFTISGCVCYPGTYGGVCVNNATSFPTSSPTLKPTYSPSVVPTLKPSSPPTTVPTFVPSVVPTLSPTYVPSVVPTFKPSSPPTVNPTFVPSVVPTFKPSSPPTTDPTFKPSSPPTFSPSYVPSVNPTFKPSSPPTTAPTFVPSVSPTFVPSVSPTTSPTFKPSVVPTTSPTFVPSVSPTFKPSVEPTTSPTFVPSVSPSFSPTRVPSVSPTFSPSVNPTTSPSVVPSVCPSFSPSSPPTVSPTFKPSTNPTTSPSVVPSVSPTFSPSSPPTVNPTFKPSVEPTLSPSYVPSVVPTFKPSSPPTIDPTFVPSVVPTLSPSYVPSVVPTFKPSSPPTVNPTFVPSVVPTLSPSFVPSVVPTFKPSSPPTLRPTPNPTANPTRNPTFTISNELYCDKDYVPSSSETCLLVTLTDQFGDGWTNGDGKSENAEFEYSIGYTGGDFSSVISHKLNCSCEKVMGCIHPVGLNRNQIFSFSVSSLVDSTPEYYWEIMWKVQIVEKGVNKGYFYGGYSTELILNYNYDTGVYSYDSSSSNVWDLSSCTAPSPINLVSDLAVDGYSITDTSKKTLFSSEDPFCSFTRAPTFAPSPIPTINPTPGTGGRTPTPRPTIASTVVQMSATTDLTGLSASQVDEGVQEAFISITANALGVDSEDINITSITDVSVRRLGSNGRYLSTPQVRIGFTIVIVLEQSSYTSGSEAVSGLQTLLTQGFSSSTTASDLVSLAIQLGSTTVTSSTVLVISSPTIDSDFVIIIVRTDSPTPSPKNDDEEDDTTAIIIGVVVGGVAFLGIVGGLIYFMFMKNGNKVNPV